MTSIKKDFYWKACVVIVISIILGIAFLLGAYLLPSERIKYNIRITSTQMADEGSYYQWAKYYQNARLDTCTDAYLLLAAMHPNSGKSFKEIIVDAMNGTCLGVDGENESSVFALSHDESIGEIETAYGRYWHGMLTFLKPVLCIFDLADLRMFFMIINISLIVVAALGFAKNKENVGLVALGTSLVFINPITMTECICFSFEFIIMMVAVCIMLYFNGKLLERNRFDFFFLILGILYAYYSEMSFPFVGYGIPVIVFLILNKPEWKKGFWFEIRFGIEWAIGYAGMWLGKWIMASIVTKHNYIQEALDQILYFTVDFDKENASFLDRLIKNLTVYYKWPFVLTLLVAALYILICRFVQYKRSSQNIRIKSIICLLDGIPMLLMFLFPFGLILVLGNGYSWVHFWFTHRVFAISAMAIIVFLSTVIREVQIGDEN